MSAYAAVLNSECAQLAMLVCTRSACAKPGTPRSLNDIYASKSDTETATQFRNQLLQTKNLAVSGTWRVTEAQNQKVDGV
eukprot:1193919-Amphidinium_carterae.1